PVQRGAVLELAESGPARVTVTLGGDWSKDAALPPPDIVRERLAARSDVRELTIEAVALGRWDSALLAFVRRVDEIGRGSGVTVDHSRLPTGIRHLLALAGPVPATPPRAPGRHELLEAVGCWALGAWSGIALGIALLGELTMALPRLVRGRA